MVTFEFKSEKNWLRVYDELYDTGFHFTSYGYKAITVFDEAGAEFVKKLCKASRIAVVEI